MENVTVEDLARLLEDLKEQYNTAPNDTLRRELIKYGVRFDKRTGEAL